MLLILPFYNHFNIKCYNYQCLDAGQVIVDVVFTKFTPRQHCRFVEGTPKLVSSMYKPFCEPPFMLIIVPYNAVYCNYMIVMQWLVGLGIKAKRQFASTKNAL